MKTKKYERGLDAKLLDSLSKKEGKEGELYPLIQKVKSREDLVIQIRDNYFNVYFQGGNIAEVKSAKSVIFDRNYFRKHKEKEKEDWHTIDKQKEEAKRLFVDGQFDEYIDFVKENMLSYWENVLDNKGIAEQTAQHKICLSNTDNDEYTILDLEYQVSKKSKFKYKGKRETKKGGLPTPRFDIIAVRNCDHKLCVIELKKGSKALKDPSGVQEHAESYANTIGFDKNTQKFFVEEMSKILSQKKSLSLIGERINIDTSSEPEFLFAYQYDPNDKKYPSIEKQKKLFKYYQNKEYIDGFNYAKDKMVIWLNENDYSLHGKGE